MTKPLEVSSEAIAAYRATLRLQLIFEQTSQELLAFANCLEWLATGS
ncbi:MAG: hypothetical protein RML36_03640 [Anaerolineae bacterium]|nr:hypothetical protein [Anaerolineae bacterium]MDW8098562.1 hypothetical protein [Anaerolineae bacterium]